MKGGRIAQSIAYLRPVSAARVQIRLPEFFCRKFIDVAELIDSSAQPRVIVDSAKSLKVDQTNAVLTKKQCMRTNIVKYLK